MGNDCSLFIYPERRLVRVHPLGRWFYFLHVYEPLGIADRITDCVPAHRMLSAVAALPEIPAAGRSNVIRILRRAILRWGACVPVALIDEERYVTMDPAEYQPPDFYQRLLRKQTARRRRDNAELRDQAQIKLEEWQKSHSLGLPQLLYLRQGLVEGGPN